MTTVYSTSDVHPRDRINYWVEVATKGFVAHRFQSKVGAAFRGSVSISTLGEIGVGYFDCDGATSVRGAREIAREENDELLLCLQVSGNAVFDQDGREALTEPGSLVLLDPRRPFAISSDEEEKGIAFKIPRELLEARLGAISSMTARAISSKGPIAGLASGFLAMLPEHIDTLDDQTARKVSEQALDMIALVFSKECDQNGLALSSARATALMRLKSTVESALYDPNLKPASVAAAAGMSVRYANALLSSEGTSLERYIQDRRLERCRGALGDPVQAHRTIGEIAYSWGFSDLSHFGRRFKAEYGYSPSDYRRRMTGMLSRSRIVETA
jgi:AraC-like DNA-binding protein